MKNKLVELRQQIAERIVGNTQTIEHILVCLAAGGHLLLEGPPGVGKTELCKALAKSMDMDYKRVQCTPDLRPKDIIGQVLADTETGFRTLEKGPIFTNILLVDEINRAQPKTQSAFLEAMAEGSVTSFGHMYPLPDPFLLMATQNPIEYDGTYHLPEAQQDRFLLKTKMTYLRREDEKSAIAASMFCREMKKLFEPKDAAEIKRQVAEVEVPGHILDLIVAVVSATRSRKEALVGAGTRASVAFVQAAKARANLECRSNVTEDDLRSLAHPVLRHRLVMNPDAKNFGYTPDDLISDILRKTGIWQPPSIG